VPAETACEQAFSELLPQQRFLIVVDYVRIELCERGGRSVLSQSCTIVQICDQMFLIRAQNLLSCPQGKSGSMLLSVTAAGSRAGSWVNQYDARECCLRRLVTDVLKKVL